MTIEPAPAWLSASPNPVDEGAAVTVTAHLDTALNRDVTITISIREDGDMAPREDIHIAAGATSGTYVLRTKHDDDARDGEVTVGIAKLSDGVWHGITEDQPSSLRITIKDDEAQASGAARHRRGFDQGFEIGPGAPLVAVRAGVGDGRRRLRGEQGPAAPRGPA